MKTIFLTVFFGILFSTAQSLLPVPVYDYGMNCDNIYRDRTGEPVIYPSASGNNPRLEPMEPNDLQFTGEYQIFLQKMGIYDTTFIVALTIEAVSFPFVPDFGNITFIPGSSPRNCLVLDTESTDLDTSVIYDAVHSSDLPCINFYNNIPTPFKAKISPNKRWNEVDYTHSSISYTFNLPVYLKFSQKIRDRVIGGSQCHGRENPSLAGVNAWSFLASKFFADSRLSTATHPYTVGSAPGQIYLDPRIIFPHTVLKHTFWVINDNTGDTLSYSYVVDWTRGIFRTYPFTLCGSTSSEAEHDISMDAWLADRVIPRDTTCSAIGYVTNAGTVPDPLEYLYPPKTNSNVVKFELNGADIGIKIPLGYKQDNTTSTSLIPIVPPAQQCTMQYFIDKSIDLTKINPIEKVVYNPSEVTIKNGVNLVFPSCYTFRTVRSTYPKTADSTNLNPNNPNGWNSIHNGGPYQDLREIPIPTDLSPTSDPNDASVYIIENGATVVLQDGVTLYDCTFKVKPGGNILNYDSKDVAGRFKIQWLDGSDAITQQYIVHKGRVQKEEIHLNNLIIDADVIFEAKRIYAGDITAVTLNPTGKRKVVFKAEQEANLKQIHVKPNHPHAQYELFFGNSCGKNTSVNY